MSSNARDWFVVGDVERPEAGRSTMATLEVLVEAGAGLAERAASVQALRQYWSLLHVSTPVERETLHSGLRERVRSGVTTHRAWLAPALGETDGALAIAAVHEYLGGAPVSLAKRTAAISDVIDWIRRALPLRRSAVFAALVARADEATFVELRRLRGLLSRDEAAEVWALSAACERAPACEFIADWREALHA